MAEIKGKMFFSTSEFDKKWEAMGLDMDDLRRLENEILNNPQIGSVVQGTGGLRKIRFASENTGKSGGVRALYVDYVVFERVYLITAYPKSQKEDISPAEKAIIKKLIEQTYKELGGKDNE